MTRDEILSKAQAASSASLHEAAGRTGALPSSLRPLDPARKVFGFAHTVRCPGGDNLWLHHAILSCPVGDVLVVEAALRDYGYWGEIMAVAAQVRGIAGLVITGGVRDSQRMIEMGFPVFSETICIRGTLKNPNAGGAIGADIRLGDMVVRNGDFIFGDADGLFLSAPETIAETLRSAEARDAKEVDYMARLRAGETTLSIYNLPQTGAPK